MNVAFFNDLERRLAVISPIVGHLTLDRAIRDHAFTRGLTEAQIASLASLASEVTFEENQVILVNGQRSTSLYLVVEGSVAVELYTRGFTVCVQAVGMGQVFGWSALLDHQDTTFQVRARERTTALRLEGSALSAMFQRDPQLGVELLRRTLKVVAGRVRATEARFAEMCGMRI